MKKWGRKVGEYESEEAADSKTAMVPKYTVQNTYYLKDQCSAQHPDQMVRRLLCRCREEGIFPPKAGE